MTKDTIKNLALILLLGITIFSVIRYASELRARFRLEDNLTQAQSEISVLTQQKQNLLQKLEKEQKLNEQLTQRNVNLKAYLIASKGRIRRFFQENTKIQDELGDINAKFEILKAENRALIDIHKRIYVENEQFKVKMGSVAELKKAIKELKASKRKGAGWQIEGNRGFLIKDGHLTSEKVKIEVTPVPGKSM
ncbi:MAG: hypothetical protein NT014_03975 [Candidatus Omnitrophica bacterium]|nr:hypothetical protein [Candidatus Omnitrophota bacterium]